MSAKNSPMAARKSARKSAASSKSSAIGSRGKTPAGERRQSKSPAGRSKSPPKSRSSRSKSPPKSAASKGSKSSSNKDRTESATGKAGSATMRRVSLRTESITSQGLRTVELVEQGMTSVPQSIFQKKDKGIGILDMSHNNIRSVPSDIRKLQTLIQLDLSNNTIRCNHNEDFGGLPNELASLPNLEVVIISENNLPFIPPVIWKCKRLKILDISRNKINILPPDVGNLEELQHLNAQQTSISTLPPEIAYCQNLEDVLLWGNVIENLPDTMREMPKLKNLSINNRSFTQIVDSYMDDLLRKGQIQSEHIPNVLFEIPALDILDLSETKINALPEKCVGQLKEFYLAKNYFTKVPDMVMTLNALQTLDISNNLIKDIPETIGQIKTLTCLKMNNNAFLSVPPSIGQLENLEELELGGNRISALPDSIGNLKNLKCLIMDRNELASLPNTLIKLEGLHTLDLTQNQITTLPINFYHMKISTAHSYNKYHKHGLWLHLNPLKCPPPEVWKTEDPKQIYRYLRKLEIMRTENLQRQKLILLGESQAGKTSLLQSMFTGKSCMTAGLDDSTDVADFINWTTENLVTFLVHDIGGEEVYKPTHPLFLDPNAFYLIVYDHRKYTPEKHNSAIGYWLELLYTYCPGAVVKFVGTQCDQCNEDFIEKTLQNVKEKIDTQVNEWERKIESEINNINQVLNSPELLSEGEINNLKKQKFKMVMLKRSPLKIIDKIALVNCTDGIPGVYNLISDLEVAAVNKDYFPNAQRATPEQWNNLRKLIRQSTKKYLLKDEIKDIAKTLHITKDHFDNFLLHLQNTGEILWYDKIPALKDIIFPRPRALVHILKGLFSHRLPQFLNYDTNKLFSSLGRFDAVTFELHKEKLATSGEISRQMLLCMWFYLQNSQSEFEDLLELIPKFDLCYTIQQPDLPIRRNEFYPLMVIPFYNNDDPPEDLDDPPEGFDAIWSDELGTTIKEVELGLTFPFLYPNGLFERLSCRLQEKVSYRTDWRDMIYVEFFSGKMLLLRHLNPDNYDCIIRIKVRGEDINFIKNTLAFVYRELGNLLSISPGLVWYKGFRMENCGTLTVQDCFPREVLATD